MTAAVHDLVVLDLPPRRWLPVVGWEGVYEVSSAGDVRRVGTDRALKAWPSSGGYRLVRLYRAGRGRTQSVHRLVAEAFIGPCPGGLQVNHKDGRKTNNAVANLAYVTGSENQRHAYRLGLQRSRAGARNGNARLAAVDVAEIRRLHAAGVSVAALAVDYAVGRTAIQKIVTGRTWKAAA